LELVINPDLFWPQADPVTSDLLWPFGIMSYMAQPSLMPGVDPKEQQAPRKGHPACQALTAVFHPHARAAEQGWMTLSP
jgi:hypothetical protein